ncbi:LPXTG cell wall anchor domain-containing protein [Nocardioides sp. GY 10113]|nr:LPXTG cell wall anchor domain-containing protein [Nocardioides sp. GY 10113]
MTKTTTKTPPPATTLPNTGSSDSLAIGLGLAGVALLAGGGLVAAARRRA